MNQQVDQNQIPSQDVLIDLSQLKASMRTSCVTFLAFYLGDELTLEVPELHEEIWDDLLAIIDKVNLNQWIGHIQKLFCVPRGHAKSTITKLAIILFFRYSRIRFCLYVSLTSTVAVQACKDIYNWLTSPQDQALYGPMGKVHQSNETKGIWIWEIQTPDYGLKKVILKSLGTDQQVRGTLIDNQRPELIVIDDCEDLDTAATAASQAKIDTWVMGNLMKASARRSVRIMLGNMISSTTLLARLSKDPEWNPTVYGAIIRDKRTGELKALWPGLYRVEDLIAEYKKYRKLGTGHVWIYEMMNMTQDSVFQTSMVNAVRLPRPSPDQVTAGIIILDPAFGLKEWHDESALTVHVHIEGSGIPHVVETRRGRMTESKLLDNLIEMSYYWNLATWGVESVAGQQLFIPLFKTLLVDRGIPHEIFTMIPLLSGGTAKSSRILAMTRAISEGHYGVAEEEEQLMEHFEKYNPSTTEHEDDIDSASYGPIAWAKAGEQVKNSNRLATVMALLQNGVMTNSLGESEFVPF